MTKTFQEFLSEDLAGFGWTIEPGAIPEYEAIEPVLHRLRDWYASVPEGAIYDIVSEADVADALWAHGYFAGFEGMYSIFKGNRCGTVADNLNDFIACLKRAHNQVGEQPGGLPGGSGVDDVVGAG